LWRETDQGSLFLLSPKGMWWLDALSMVVFGLAIGAYVIYVV